MGVDEGRDSWKPLIRDLNAASSKGQNEYQPIGTYVFLGRDPQSVKEIESTSESIPEFLGDVQLQKECLAEHQCSNYLRALLGAFIIEGQVDPTGNYHPISSLKPPTGPKPEVSIDHSVSKIVLVLMLRCASSLTASCFITK